MNMPVKPEWIIFDLGDVVVRLNRHLRYVKSFEAARAAGQELVEILENHLGDNFVDRQTTFSLNERFQIGKLTIDEFLDQLLESLGGRITRDELIEDSLAVLGEGDPGVQAIIVALKENYHVGCFSNTHALHWDHLVAHYPVMANFEFHGASHFLGIAKPGPEAYRAFCKALGTPPEKCVFIDDRELNIVGAREVGMDAIHFKNAGQLTEELTKRNIL